MKKHFLNIMNYRAAFALALTLGALLLLTHFASTTRGQQSPQMRIAVADTGIVTLSPQQMLRLTVTGDWNGDGDVSPTTLFFRRLEYAQTGHQDGLNKTTLLSNITSEPITLAPGEDASFDIPNMAFAVRGIVSSNRPEVRVTALIVNRTTGEVEVLSSFDGAFDPWLTEEQVTKAKQPVRVVRRINQARLTAAMIRTIRSSPVWSAAVTVRGNTIIPLEGSSLWLLSNRGFALVTNGDSEPLASETWTKDMGEGDLYVASCFCPGATANPDDGCAFDGPASRQNCKGPNCCAFKDGVILGDGTPILF